MVKRAITWNKTILYPLMVFFLVSLPFVLINGVWWDDYTVWNVTPSSLYNYLGPDDANEVFQYAYISLITNIFPLNSQVLAFHILAVVFQAISLISIWYVLKRITNDALFTLFTMLLVASFGLDKARFLIICSHSVIANCLFFIGMALFVKEYYNNSKLLVILVSLLWLLSLCVWRTAALLMPLCIFIAGVKATNFNVKDWNTYKKLLLYSLKHYWPIIIAFIIFLVVYKLFLAQSGPHATYYEPSLMNIILAPFLAIASSIQAIFYFFTSSLGSFTAYSNLPFFFVSLVAVALVYILIRHEGVPSFNRKYLFLYSFLFLALTLLLPLTIYGIFKLVGFDEYDTRTLCLSALPIAIISIMALQKLNRKVFLIAFSILFIGSVLYNFHSTLDYSFSTIKQEAFVNYLKENKQLENQSIMVQDMAFSLDANNTAVRNYEYEGLARIAYGVNSTTRIMSFYGGNQHIIEPEVKIDIIPLEHPVGIPTKFQVFFNVFILNKHDMKEYYASHFLRISHSSIK